MNLVHLWFSAAAILINLWSNLNPMVGAEKPPQEPLGIRLGPQNVVMKMLLWKMPFSFI